MAQLKSSRFILAGAALIVVVIFVWLMFITRNDVRGIWTVFYMLVLPYVLIL